MLSVYFIKKGSGVYDRLEERVIIKPDCLRSVCNQIREKNQHKNLRDYKIGIIIGGHKNTISNALKGDSIPYKVFKKLEKLLGKPIPHIITTPIGELFELEENEKNAEFLAIMLGDGNLNENNYSITIALNGVDEYPYVKYVSAFMEHILKKKPKEIWARENNDPKRTKGVKLRIYSLAAVKALKEAGIIPGDKVKHQVSIPQKFKKFTKRCLKGLIDTDGTIYIQKKDKSFVITFVNGSKPLVKNFKELCSKLKIDNSKLNEYLRKDDNKYIYSVSIGSKYAVKKFLDLVHPEKWKDKNRREFWGIQLKYLNASDEIRNSIEKQIEKDYPDPKNRKFSIDFLGYMRNLCKKYNLEISNDSIECALSKALTYKRNQYTKEFAEYLKKLFIKLGDIKKVKENFKDKPIDDKTIKKYLFLLFEEVEYEKYKVNGENGFKTWYENNKNIIAENREIKSLGTEKRKIISIYIYNIIKRAEFNIKNEDVLEKLKYIINNEELSFKTEKDNQYKILRLERLFFLLNNDDYKNSMEQLLLKHIEFIQIIITLSNQNKKYGITEFWRKFPFISNTTQIRAIIKKLEKEFSVKFNIFK